MYIRPFAVRLLKNLRGPLVAVSGLIASNQAIPLFAADVPPIRQPIGKSVEGQSIDVLQFGSGLRPYLVIGPLHGNAVEASQLADQLAGYLSQSPPQLAGKRITLLLDANPDGRRRSRAENGHGVDLDRNFATADWQAVTFANQWVSGRAADTEPETRAVANLIATLQPSRIVQLRAASRNLLSNAGPSEDLTARINGETSIPALTNDPSLHAGSLSKFAAERRIPTLTLWAQRDNRLVTNRQTLFRALLLSIDFDVPVSEAQVLASRVPEATGTATTPTGSFVAAGPSPQALSTVTSTNEAVKASVLRVDQLSGGAPLAPVVSPRAAALHRASAVTPAAPPSRSPQPSPAVPPSNQVRHAVVTEKTVTPAAPSSRQPEKPIPVGDADLD